MRVITYRLVFRGYALFMGAFAPKPPIVKCCEMHMIVFFCIDCYQLVAAKEVFKQSAVAALAGSIVANLSRIHAETIAENWNYAEEITDYY